MPNLGQRQDPWQYDSANAEVLVIEANRLVVGGRTLHRQMQRELRMLAAGVIQHADIGGDHRVRAEFRRPVHRGLPAFPTGGLREGVKRDEHAPTSFMRVPDALRGRLGVEIQAGEMPGVGLVAEPEVHGVGTLVDGGLERGQIARRTDQFQRFRRGKAHDGDSMVRPGQTGRQ